MDSLHLLTTILYIRYDIFAAVFYMRYTFHGVYFDDSSYVRVHITST